MTNLIVFIRDLFDRVVYKNPKTDKGYTNKYLLIDVRLSGLKGQANGTLFDTKEEMQNYFRGYVADAYKKDYVLYKKIKLTK